MAKFAIGDVVKKDKGDSGVVRAIFTTMAGNLCYAVEHEGALDFVEEAKLSASPKDRLSGLTDPVSPAGAFFQALRSWDPHALLVLSGSFSILIPPRQ